MRRGTATDITAVMSMSFGTVLSIMGLSLAVRYAEIRRSRGSVQDIRP
ncbi:hypothetical protein [Citrobacter amalonaticus]